MWNSRLSWQCDHMNFGLNAGVFNLTTITPPASCCRFAFSRLHPLLGRAVDLQSANHVQSSIIPLSMHLPAEQVTLRLEPMKLLLKAKGIVTGLMKLLRIGCGVDKFM